MSNWEDTVMSIDELLLSGIDFNKPLPDWLNLVQKKQAEVSFLLGGVSVAREVLAIIENPKQVNYRLKEITKYCEDCKQKEKQL